VKKEKIIVYWGSKNKEHLRATEPTDVFKEYCKDKDINKYEHVRCPDFLDSLKNTYAIHSTYATDMSFDREKGSLNIDNTQNFYDNNIIFRDTEIGMVTLLDETIFFTEEKKLNIEVMPAHLEDNSFTKNTIFIPGVMDIASWFRPIDITFYFRKDSDSIRVCLDDAVMYVKFHTDKEIEFVKYEVTARCRELIDTCTISRDNKGITKKLKYYYNLFSKNNMKSKVLAEIKNNIC
jgi:hypothetical protein